MVREVTWSVQGHTQEVNWAPGPGIPKPEVFRVVSQKEGGDAFASPPPKHRPGPQRGQQGGKPHPSICPPCRAAGRRAQQEQLSGCRACAPLGPWGRRPHHASWNRDCGVPCPQPLAQLQAGDSRDSGPDTRFLCPGAKGTTPSFPLGVPQEEKGLCGLAFLCVCVGLQLFLPFLNGSRRPRGALRTRGAPTARRTWISTLESLPFSRF